jgi:hypothetical protein
VAAPCASHIPFTLLAIQSVDRHASDRGTPAAPWLLTVWRHAPWPFVLMGGLVGGLAWGMNARLWMRFISTNPEFTWSGTLFIVIGFGIAGLAQSGAYLGRRANLTRPAMTVLRVVAVIALLPLGFAAGASMFPTIILATLALTHHTWPRWLRGIVAAVALFPAVATALSFFDDLSLMRAVAGVIWFLAIYAGIIWAARFSLGPQLDGWRVPMAARVLGVVALAPLILLAILITIDVRSNG